MYNMTSPCSQQEQQTHTWILGSHRGQGQLDVQKRFHIARRTVLEQRSTHDQFSMFVRLAQSPLDQITTSYGNHWTTGLDRNHTQRNFVRETILRPNYGNDQVQQLQKLIALQNFMKKRSFVGNTKINNLFRIRR